MNGLKEWQQLFDDNVAQIWKQEPISMLKNLSMMVFCLNREISHVQRNSGILKEQSNNSSMSVIISDDDLCKSEESTGSPEIKKNRRSFRYKQKYKKKLTQNDRTLTRSKLMMIATKGQQSANQESVNLLQANNNKNCLRKNLPFDLCKALKSEVRTPKKTDSDMDFSVIESTPVRKPASFRTREVKRDIKNNKLTITQMFSSKDQESFNSFECQNSTSNQATADTVMGITSLVNYLNNDACEEKSASNSAPEENTGLNSAIVENKPDLTNEEVLPDNLNAFLAKAQNVPNQLEAEPVVRGKLRQQLPGWSCKDCEKFYLNQGLTANEILALTKKCSKHRGYYMPREDTFPGYWDLNLGSQESENT
ncbi:uncharacterized protein LOC109537517 isoform X2 [Dendroctonus ponderosae]|uniref:uncharacterized protein LOC109537517 isoform X2 n=1 Tax=Dendroctonus ponderosae TaxID=77166 RepID=UPI002034A85F|nr:uncharacterized protein LOC109537517 isoform X2 [Dendroctonus ponderosae]